MEMKSAKRAEAQAIRQMSSLEYMQIVRELQPLAGQRLEKFVDYGAKSFRLRIGKTDIAIDAPVRMNITKYIRDSPQTPTDFAFAVRKRIGNARLDSVFQHEADRVIAFEFSKENEKFTLVFEMFASGNCVLADKDSICMAAAEYDEWKDREIRVKKPYKFPAARIGKAGMFDVSSAISGKFISSCLSALPIGTAYTNTALARLGIGQKTKGSELEPAQIEAIGETLREMAAKPVPRMYFDAGGKPMEFALADLDGFNDSRPQEFPTLSECADEYYNANPASAHGGQEEGESPEVARLEEMEKKQSEHIAGLEAQAKEAGAAGKAIISSLALVESAIAYAKGKRPEPDMAAQIARLEKSGKLKIDRKNGKLEIEIGAETA